MDNTKVVIRRKRSSEYNNNWKKDNIEEYPPGPIQIYPSWNPINRHEKPPYSYATIIGHAILTSKERRLTLHDIYVWITENYPFYSNDTQGWQNSIRHNLSLHKSFVKIERDISSQNPPRKGCFWTILPGRERHFIDNLQRPVHSIKRHNSLSQFVSNRKNQQVSRRHSSTSTLGRFNPLRTTAEIPSTTTHSESEPNSLLVSSDHLSSRSSSLSRSPNYHDLFGESYNVYPATEIFDNTTTTMYNQPYPSSTTSGQSVTYSSSSNSSSSHYHPPCDTYSSTPILSYPSLLHNKSTTTTYYKLHGALKFHHDKSILLGSENTFLQPSYHDTTTTTTHGFFSKEDDTTTALQR